MIPQINLKPVNANIISEDKISLFLDQEQNCFWHQFSVLGEIKFIVNISLLLAKFCLNLFLNLALLFGDGIPSQKGLNRLYFQRSSQRFLASASSQNQNELSLQKSNPCLAQRSHSLRYMHKRRQKEPTIGAQNSFNILTSCSSSCFQVLKLQSNIVHRTRRFLSSVTCHVPLGPLDKSYSEFYQNFVLKSTFVNESHRVQSMKTFD